MGGTAAEVFRDRAPGSAAVERIAGRAGPWNRSSWPLLQGYRGKPGVNIDRLIEILMRFSYLVADYPEIKELDVNPLLVTSEDVLALDARVVVDRDIVAHSVRPYAHLAVRPYPEEFVTERKMKDGTPVVLRPIGRKTSPCGTNFWRAAPRRRCGSASAICSSRPRTRWPLLLIDYDREIGIVAEVEEDGERKLIGSGPAGADMNHETAEYAVIVVDRWHGHGLGGLLTDYA